MSKKENKNKDKEKNKANRNQIFVRIMSAILAIFMVAAVASTCVYYLINL